VSVLKRSLRSLWIGLAGAAVAALATLVWAGIWAGVDLPVLPKAKASAVPGQWECVEPTADMRRNHMKYLLHHRDKTMHEGIRTKQHSLRECIDCHAVPGRDGKIPSIHSREHFCNSCHSYAAVKMDCWECHTPKPAGQALSVETMGKGS
jgi:hypothetical protein